MNGTVEACSYSRDTALVKADGFSFVKKNSVVPMQGALIKGPIAALVDASSLYFQTY